MKKLVPIILLAAAAGGFLYYRSGLWRGSESGALILSGNIEVTDAHWDSNSRRLLGGGEGDTVTAGQIGAAGPRTENQLAQAGQTSSSPAPSGGRKRAHTGNRAAHAAMEQARFRRTNWRRVPGLRKWRQQARKCNAAR